MASRGLNRVQLIGNVGRPPEMRYTSTGKAVTTFSVAVSRGSHPSETEHAPEPDWFRIIAWEKLAELCNQLLHKGSRVYLEGRLQTRIWRDDQGQDHAVTEVVAGELLLLDSRPAGEAPVVPGPPAGDDLPF